MDVCSLQGLEICWQPPVLLAERGATGRYLTQTYSTCTWITRATPLFFFFSTFFWQWGHSGSLSVRLWLYVRVTATEPGADTAFFTSFLLEIFHARTLSSFKSRLKTGGGTFYHIKFEIIYSYLKLCCSCAVTFIQSVSFSFSSKEGSHIFQVCLKAILRWTDASLVQRGFRCCNRSSCPNLIQWKLLHQFFSVPTVGLSL